MANLQEVIHMGHMDQVEAMEWIVKLRQEEFLTLFKQHPLRDRPDPSHVSLSEAFWIWMLARDLEPRLVVESGTHQGWSAWWLQQSMPLDGLFVTIDPNQMPLTPLTRTRHTHTKVDFNEPLLREWLSQPSSLAFFDDHQDQSWRLRTAAERGFKDVVFHDCYPAANAAHVTLWRTGLPEGATALAFPVLRHPDAFRDPLRSWHSWLTWVRLA